MGILSNPQQRQKIVDTIAKYNNKICFLCYVAGVAWFLALAYPPMNAKNYFSENALLPGLVENEFYSSADIKTYIEEYRAELKKDARKVPREWVYEKLRSIGLDTYIHNYSIRYPLGITKDKMVPGQNVYGILRAPRAASNEALVMSSPLRAKESDLTSTTGGIAVMLAIARFFRQKTYWAKDIIFLFTDHEQIGIQAWLDGYHDIEAEYIQPGELMGHSGQIQAALNLEIPAGNILSYNVKIEGLNGQLPNLDFFNLVVRLCKREGVDVTLHKQNDPFLWNTLPGYRSSLSNMMQMMWTQASGISSGNHGLFLRYHIEALTLEGIAAKKGQLRGLEKAGRVIEGVFRSLNNLLERFHQSFFFYILPTTSNYISIGIYMPPFGLICAAGLIKAIALWVALSAREDENKEITKKEETDDEQDDTKESTDKENTGEERENSLAEDIKDKSKDEEELLRRLKETLGEEDVGSLNPDKQQQLQDLLDDVAEPPTGLLSILPLILISMLMGVLSYTGPEFITSVAPPIRMKIDDVIAFGLMALFTASLLFPRMVGRKSDHAKNLAFDWELLKSLALIFQSLVLFSISLMNISLAFFLAVVLVPVTVIVHPTHSRMLNLIQKAVVFLISPASMVLAAAMISCIGEKSTFLGMMGLSWDTTKHGLLLTIIDNYFFSSWMYPFFSLLILPNWLFFWGIIHCQLPKSTS
ncbi:glycosylphosphatidylinositol anchor attachment 1 protein-like [Ylistrum balloti]|uniref:glycosylphosphatidylinositol anchor attachment 1 protein-like n=1 Tax=Ylistrum balloti TaxID=509963 RepID=UPI0029059D08|nr:glycosylphosphatidylinositol anchor attachment 1 protein-like [Ylistrum balloti]